MDKSSDNHKIFIRKKNFELLSEKQFNKKEKKAPSSSNMPYNMATDTNQLARHKYYQIMQLKMKRNIFLTEVGLVIQPLMFWLGVSPDGLISDK